MLVYSKCSLGKRCIVKTNDNYIFRKFTLLCAISNSKCVGATLYKEGGMNKERFVEFLEEKVLKYDDLVIKIKNVIKQVKKENYKNYFENAYNKDAYKDYVKKDTTLKRKLKNYKD